MEENDSPKRSEPTMTLVAGLEALRVVRIPQFLPKRERDAIFDAMCANRKAFQNPGIPGSKQGNSWYLSMESDDLDQRAGDVHKAVECLRSRIRRLIPTASTLLGVESFPITKFPLTLVNGLDGHSGSPHADDSGDRYRISLLYYFHRAPKAFRGGDLEFYNADPASPNGHGEDPVAKIDFEDNLLIAFPSHTFHGITEVRCESNDFADGRFVAVAFLGP